MTELTDLSIAAARDGLAKREFSARELTEPDCLPNEWRITAEAGSAKERAILVSDYIAGMTDRYALEEHRRLFDPYTVMP